MPQAQKAYKKEKKCIPKEGMPHPDKACQKKREERKKEKEIAHNQEK